MMRRAVYEAITILVAALAVALVVNGLRPGGIRIVRTPDADVGYNVASASLHMMTLEEAVAKFQSGSAVFLDARSGEDYAAGHIQGAFNLPAHGVEEQIELIFEEYAPDQEIITYCGGPECPLARELAEFLADAGFEDISYFSDGFTHWRDEAHPVAVGE